MKKSVSIIIGILICFIIFVFLFTTKQSFPEKILIQVSDQENRTELNANCKADFFDKGERIIEDRQLANLKNGYYQLDTSELKDYDDYQVKIICLLPENKGVGGLSIDKTNMPCEIKKDYVVCPM